MRLLTLLAMLALCAPAAAAQGQAPGDAYLQDLAIEARAACSAPNMPPPEPGLSLAFHAEWLAGLHQRWNTPCQPNPALALRIARALADRPNVASGTAFKLLSEIYGRGIGVRANAARARDYLRKSWLVTLSGDTASPFGGVAESDAYLARPGTVAFLRRYAGVRQLPLARLRLARALLVRGRSADREEALGLLADPALVYVDEARFLRARTWLESGDAARRGQALRDLRSLSRLSGESEAHRLLSAMARRDLAAATPPERRWDAIETLAHIAFRLDPGALAPFLRAVSAANGGLPPAVVSGPEAEEIRQRLRVPMTDDDYPAAALRGEEEGRIALWGLIDPRGLLIFTRPTTPGQPPSLLNRVRTLYASRPLPPVELGRLRTTPYMWIALPGVVFTIRN